MQRCRSRHDIGLIIWPLTQLVHLYFFYLSLNDVSFSGKKHKQSHVWLGSNLWYQFYTNELVLWQGKSTGQIAIFFINRKYHFDFKLQVNFMLNSKGRMILLWNNRVFQLSRINYAESFYNRWFFFLSCSSCRYLIMKVVIRSQQVSPVFYLYFKENFEFYFQYKELYKIIYIIFWYKEIKGTRHDSQNRLKKRRKKGKTSHKHLSLINLTDSDYAFGIFKLFL